MEADSYEDRRSRGCAWNPSLTMSRVSSFFCEGVMDDVLVSTNVAGNQENSSYLYAVVE
jgi:hypothetical protein